MTDRCLIYPPLQRLYEMISNYSDIWVSHDAFDIISGIDSFLEKSRDFVFVLNHLAKKVSRDISLKSLLKESYDDSLLKQFADLRNGVVHEEPISIERTAVCSVYMCNNHFAHDSMSIVLSDEEDFSSVMKKWEGYVIGHEGYEVAFSVELLLYIEEEKILVSDFFDRLLNLYHDAILALLSMEECKCGKCRKLMEKISDKLIKSHVMKKCNCFDGLLSNNQIEYFPIFELVIQDANGKPIDMQKARLPIDKYFFIDLFPVPSSRAFFCAHLMSQIMIACKDKDEKSIMDVDLMNSSIIVFSDGSYSLKYYPHPCKATMFRMINEVARCYLNKDVIAYIHVHQVFFAEYNDPLSYYQNDPDSRYMNNNNNCLQGTIITNKLQRADIIIDLKAVTRKSGRINIMNIYNSCSYRRFVEPKGDMFVPIEQYFIEHRDY